MPRSKAPRPRGRCTSHPSCFATAKGSLTSTRRLANVTGGSQCGNGSLTECSRRPRSPSRSASTTCAPNVRVTPRALSTPAQCSVTRTPEPLRRSTDDAPSESIRLAEWHKRPFMAQRHPEGWRMCLIIGAPGRIRTHDPLVRSQVLYPTELRARAGWILHDPLPGPEAAGNLLSHQLPARRHQ